MKLLGILLSVTLLCISARANCAKSLKRKSVASPLEISLLSKIDKSKSIIASTQAASQTRATNFLEAHGIDFDDRLELTLLYLFSINSIDRYADLFSHGKKPYILSKKKKVYKSNKNSKTKEKVLKGMRASSNNEVHEDIYEAAFPETVMPFSIKEAAKIGVISDKKLLANIKSFKASKDLQATHRRLNKLIDAAYAHIVDSIFDAATEKIEVGTLGKVKKINPIFKNIRDYLVAVKKSKGMMSINSQALESSVNADIKHMTQMAFGTEQGQRKFSKLVYSNESKKSSNNVTTKPLTASEFERLSDLLASVYSVPLEMLEFIEVNIIEKKQKIGFALITHN